MVDPNRHNANPDAPSAMAGVRIVKVSEKKKRAFTGRFSRSHSRASRAQAPRSVARDTAVCAAPQRMSAPRISHLNLGRKVVSGALVVALMCSYGAFGAQAASADDVVVKNLQDITADEYLQYTLGFNSEELQDYLNAKELVGIEGAESAEEDIADVSNPMAAAYRDVPANDYYTEAVDYVTTLGFMDGVSATAFSPDALCTRAVVVEVLYRIDGSPSASAPRFSDVSTSSPYAAAIGWAASHGIVTGYGDTGTFGPNDLVTREQLATILFRYVTLKQIDDGIRADLSKFPDNQTVSSWARECFAWANAKGIITGVSNTWLQPFGGATRAQLAVIAQRYCTNILKLSAADNYFPAETTLQDGSSSLNGTSQAFEDGSVTEGSAFSLPTSVALSPADMSRAARSGNCAIDTSTASNGYVTATAVSSSRLKLQVVNGSASYNYDMANNGTPITVPLNMGNGSYKIRIMQNTTDSKYVELFSSTVNAVMTSATAPFVRPNVFCSYTANSACVAKARELAADAKNQGAALRAVYRWITTNISYDRAKAAQLSQTSGYIPNPDETLSTKKGICFDYASLAAAMLRSLGIPCKVMTGYVSPGNLYHAWNMVYIDGKWVSVKISVDPLTWTRIDATFAASGGGADNYVGNGTGYTDRYTY